MKKFKKLNKQRQTRKFRVSNAVKRYSTRPRLCVTRSNKHISAQIIDDAVGKTLVSAGTIDKKWSAEVTNGGNCEAAARIGEAIAKLALAADITQVAFDRSGNKYHGRVKELADAARKAGLDIGAMPDPSEVKPKKVRTTEKKQKAEPQFGPNKGAKPGAKGGKPQQKKKK